MQAKPGWDQLLVAARAGDKLSLERLWSEARQWIHEYSARHLGEDLNAKMDASDIVQQSMLEAQVVLDQFRGSTFAEFHAWLITVIRRNIADAGRRYRQSQCRSIHAEENHKNIHDSYIAADDPSPSARMVSKEADAVLAAAIEALPSRYQVVLELRHRDELEFSEIGDRLQISSAAARQLWVRAIETVRSRLSRANEFTIYSAAT